ncbi:hypothetical protein HDU84_008742 [Entophlyctis sp. JEL0112]|nr:hypothetical protein HDU84_008742 [Entophlyctis sp. JEL0112]
MGDNTKFRKGAASTAVKNVATSVAGVVAAARASSGLSSANADLVEYYREAYTLFDADHNGYIDVHELGDVMRSCGMDPTEEEVRAMIAVVDVDGTGTIDFDEFLLLSPCNLKIPISTKLLAGWYVKNKVNGKTKLYRWKISAGRQNFISHQKSLKKPFGPWTLTEMDLYLQQI